MLSHSKSWEICDRILKVVVASHKDNFFLEQMKWLSCLCFAFSRCIVKMMIMSFFILTIFFSNVMYGNQHTEPVSANFVHLMNKSKYSIPIYPKRSSSLFTNKIIFDVFKILMTKQIQRSLTGFHSIHLNKIDTLI